LIICGLKLTHDGAVAIVENGECILSVEMEKLRNYPRYSPVHDLAIVPRLLKDFGYKVDEVDHWVIDGWDGQREGYVSLLADGDPLQLTVAAYRESAEVPNLFQPGFHGTIPIDGQDRPYTSYLHLGGHVASAYCSSRFAVAGEPSLVLAWDGGTFPRLYHVDPSSGVSNGGALFPLIGHAYATAAHHFGPYARPTESQTVDDLAVAGKLMAYIALGTARDEVQRIITSVYRRHFEVGQLASAFRRSIGGWGSNSEPSLRFVHAFFRELRQELRGEGVTDEDVLTSFHRFLEELLVERVTRRIEEWKGAGPWNLCFVGGCALNIKWNSALRAQPMFNDVWVPPFPNDSGSAFGVASAHVMATTSLGPVRWHARLGPALPPLERPRPGWSATPCTPEELGRYLHETGQPVVLLNGRAELGPRALGGRSIIAPAVDPAMKDLLNQVKNRESYRPVAPICLEELAPRVFDPGTPDPYMLFDHRVRAAWMSRIPAVLHLDGTARLQTVDDDDPVLASVLREYHRQSGIPVLCNTSANHNGRGFFPDVASAMDWGRVPAIWSDETLFLRASEVHS
jgi:carbamoyltransferase